ncbi:MAG: methionyl-tRNA formyltransferase [Sulfuriflexus sp.]|nr:methionyl-tRNA formyltransferase [Sulfuriflexus sp.]
MPKSLKIIFAGTPDFAVPSLQSLIDSPHDIVAVYTQPDRPAGRGRKLTASPVKQCAEQVGIAVEQPESLKDEEAQQCLANYEADIMVVVAYGQLLPPVVLAMPRLGCINVHASLLPRWRGAAPIQRAIVAGDSETGVTIMQMAKGLDTGDMLAKVTTPIEPNETAAELHDRLAPLGNEALLDVLTQLQDGTANPQVQDEAQTCYAAKLSKDEAPLDWCAKVEVVQRQVSAFNPFPVATAQLGEETLRIWRSQISDEITTEKFSAGDIIRADKKGIAVQTGAGVLTILELQAPGKKRLSAADFVNSRPALREAGNCFQLGEKS